MADSIIRVLRDGALEGEHAPALSLKHTLHAPLGLAVFSHLLAQHSSHILAGKSQSRGIVLVAFSRSPSFYIDLLKRRGIDVDSSDKWLRILDCYTDPLGWKARLAESGNITNPSLEALVPVSLCKDVRNLDDLFSSIIGLGKDLVIDGKDRFSVALDSVSEIQRHTSLSSVARVLSNLRSHGRLSCVFWLLNSDLVDVKSSASLDYMSSMMADIETVSGATNLHRDSLENLSLLEQNYKRGKLNVRFKRRNGRVRNMCEEFSVDQSGIKFSAASSGDGIVSQSLVPKVQFNLQLSEKELNDRAKVVLPFEHQGNEKAAQIYDGRRSLAEGIIDLKSVSAEKTSEVSGRGEIIYFRDSDDERPDSDEDPDDDLDI